MDEQTTAHRLRPWLAERAVALGFIALLIAAEIAITVLANAVAAPKSCCTICPLPHPRWRRLR